MAWSSFGYDVVVFQLDEIFEHIGGTTNINFLDIILESSLDVVYLHELSPVMPAMLSQSLSLGRNATPALCVEHPPGVPARG
jgi:hypothetical protein